MKKHRIIVAGCGGMANEWVKYALSRDDCEITGLVDINMENAKVMAEKYNLNAEIYIDLSTAIKETGANLVFDVTIPECHKDIVTTALKAGCDVMGEKPMSSTLEDAREMVHIDKESGQFYAVMQNRRYLKKGRAFKELVTSGLIGKPGFTCVDFFLGPHFGGFRYVMESPLILDMAIHTFDQARSYTGADPVSVYCHEFNPEGSWYKGNACAVCIFEFSDGSVLCYRGSWCAEGCNTTWEGSWRAVGSKGTAIWDGSCDPYAEVVVPPSDANVNSEVKRIEPAVEWQGNEGHIGCLDEMFLSLDEGRKAETDCADNIISVAMVFGAIQSAREGRKVMLEY